MSRLVRTVVPPTVAIVASASPARAHAWGHASGHLDPVLVIGAAVVLGTVVGVAAVGRTAPGGRLVPALAALLCGVGLVALGGAVLAAPAVAAVGGLAGAVVSSLVRRGDTAAVFALSAHRLLEGAALATLVLADALLGTVAALALVGHVCVETAALGGLCVESGRTRALGAVLGVQGAFAVGAGVGTLALPPLPATVRVGVLAAVGLVLALSGGRELGARYATPKTTWIAGDQ